MRVLQRFHRLSLDLQLIGSYLLILGVGGVAISVVGSWIVATTMRAEAQRTVAHDAAMARALYQPALLAALVPAGAARAGRAAGGVARPIGRRLDAHGDAGIVALYLGERCVAAVPASGLLPAPRCPPAPAPTCSPGAAPGRGGRGSAATATWGRWSRSPAPAGGRWAPSLSAGARTATPPRATASSPPSSPSPPSASRSSS